MSQYKAQYGKIAYSRMTYHKCKGCGKVKFIGSTRCTISMIYIFQFCSLLFFWIGFPSDFCTHRLINLVPRFCAPSTRRSRSICRQCTASPSSSTQHSTTSLRLVNLLERRRIKLFKCASEVRDDRSVNLINTINYMVIE